LRSDPNQKLIALTLTEQEKNHILKYGVGSESRSANRTIGLALIKALEEGVMVAEGRECFYKTAIKKKTIAIVAENPRNRRARQELADNYIHYRISNLVERIMYVRENPEYGLLVF
jgi:hypothetical protein